MTQEIQCGVCSTRYKVKAELSGTLVTCQRCQAKIMVPRRAKAGAADSAVGTASPVAPPPPAPSRSTPAPARAPVSPPVASAPAPTKPKPLQPRRQAPPQAPTQAIKNDDADDVIRFRDDDDDQPARSRQSEPEDDLLDIAPDPIAPSRSSGDRGSIAGLSRAGESRAGQTRAGQSQAGQSRAGQSRAGQSRAGASRAGETRAGQSRAGETRAGETRSGETRAGESRAGQSRAGRSGTAGGLNPPEHRIERTLPPADDFSDLLEVAEAEPAADDVEPFKFTLPVLPAVLTRTIMPWALIILGLGGAGYNAVSHVLDLPGKPVGLSLVGLAFVLYLLVVVGLTLKAVYSAAISAKLRLPDAVWFQTVALLAMPTAGLVIGYYVGGLGPMITLGMLGLLLMTAPMALMFRADVRQTLLTGFYAAAAYVASSALSAAILIGLGFALNRSTLVLPWKPAPEIVAAKVDQAPQVVIVPDATPTTSTAAVIAPASSTTKPVETPVVAQVAPVPTGPIWRMPVEPVASAAAWPIPQKEVRESIEVVPPIATAHSTAGGPFVALLQTRTTAIYDLRTGKRSGFLKSAFQPRNLILSPDGSVLAGVETALSQSSPMFAPDSAAGAIEIWSTADNRLLGQIPSVQGGPVPVPLGFTGGDAAASVAGNVGGKLIAYGSSNNMTGLQLWDPATASLVNQWNTPRVSQSTLAISNSGRYAAFPVNSVVRILDLHTGDIAGEMPSPADLTQMKGIGFSADGKTLAALLPSVIGAPAPGSTANATLLEWNIGDGGKLLRTLPVDLTAAAPPINPAATAADAPDLSDVGYLQWTPDGRVLRIGNGLFEATTGKPVYTLPFQTMGNLSGRLVAIADKRAVYEFPPAGTGNHFLLKTVNLPSAMIDSAVIALTGAASPLAAAPGMGSGAAPLAGASNGTSSAASAKGAGTVNAMILSPAAAAAPGGQAPEATIELAMQGEWDVNIKSVIAADPALIQKQLAAQTQAIAKTQSALDDAVLRSDQVSHYRQSTAADGEIVRQYDYSDDVRTSAQALVSNLQDRVRQEKATVIKLQHAAETAPLTRMLLGVLDNGVGVNITTDSDAGAALADKMHTGDRVHIVGFGQVRDGILQVKLRGAGPATQPMH